MAQDSSHEGDQRTFQCAVCKGVFVKGWSDEEAWKEAEGRGWGKVPRTQMVSVCDDCYALFG